MKQGINPDPIPAQPDCAPRGGSRWRWPRGETIFVLFFLFLLTLLFLVEAGLSLQWRLGHDTSLLHYVAFLLDRYHYAPYRDVWETSLPGTFLFHLAIGKTLGYGDLAFRVVDIVWLGMLLAVTWGILARFGRQVAWAGAVLFGLAYLQHGPGQSLQRDYVGLLPVAVAVFLVTGCPRWNFWGRTAAVGFLFGLSVTVKPHLALGLPLLLLFLWWEKRQEEGRMLWLRIPLVASGGFLVPPLACLAWVWLQGSWPYFKELLFTFLPLYLQVTFHYRILPAAERPGYLLQHYVHLGGHIPWLFPAAVGLLLSAIVLPSPRKRIVMLLAGLTGLYSLYPVFSGQFWPYHWFPFLYFLLLLAGLSLVHLPGRYPFSIRLIPPLILAIVAFSTLRFLPQELYLQFQGQSLPPPQGGRPDEIARFLQEHLQPDDEVQPLDWTGGAHYAMLMAQARLATPFLQDYLFYFHISNPYIQALRRRFIEQLQQTRPRFIIEVTSSGKRWVSGLDTTREFKELEAFIAAGYVRVAEGKGYVIYERK